MESKDWPDVASRSIVGTFYSQLTKLNSSDLNHLSMEQFPKWARRVIDAERKRRKKQGSTLITKAEKAIILTIGENGATEQQAPQEQRPKQKALVQQVAARVEIDGQFLHSHVESEAEYDLSYNTHLNKPNKGRSISILGAFVCKTPRCKRHRWISGIVATVLEFSTYDSSYRTTIHAQRCQKCEKYVEPKVDASHYAKKVVWVIDLWTGRREREEPTHVGPKGPHDEDRCHACEVNKCPWKGNN
ncbi:hypothetical protein BGZ46_010887 [Entomortierella lignicola]|nr:hypothetical protein BGZ46_010887 [Entomortierella lignicola]